VIMDPACVEGFLACHWL